MYKLYKEFGGVIFTAEVEDITGFNDKEVTIFRYMEKYHVLLNSGAKYDVLAASAEEAKDTFMSLTEFDFDDFVIISDNVGEYEWVKVDASGNIIDEKADIISESFYKISDIDCYKPIRYIVKGGEIVEKIH